MKKLFTILAFTFIFSDIHAQEAVARPAEEPKFKVEQYWFVMLKTGPNTKLDSAERSKLFAGHMENMGRLHKEGILKVAGPFGKNDNKWRGIFILDCKTREEAEEFVKTDPAVAAGLFAVDISPWFTEPSGNFAHGKPEPKD